MYSTEIVQHTRPLAGWLPVGDDRLAQALGRLSAEQRAVVLAPPDQASRVLAGPGSGKTTVTVLRYAYLVARGIAPESIVAVTFSRTMALELRARIKALFPAGWWHEHRMALEQITTIHALCRRLLCESGDPRRDVAKPWQVKKILKELAGCYRPAPDRELPVAFIRDMIRRAKACSVSEGDARAFFLSLPGLEPAAADCLSWLYAGYNRRMRKERLFTYDDMLGDVEIRLKDDAAFRERWQSHIQYMFLDEAQDTGAQAMRILATLAAPQNTILVVGDGDQLLYRFAGAVPEHNLYGGFDRLFPEARTYWLSINFRSTHQIVQCSQRLIAHNYTAHGGSQPDRFRNPMMPRPGAPDGEVMTFQLLATAEDEGRWVVGQIEALLKGGRRLGDFFVGARTRAQLAFVEDELARRDLPFVNLNSQSFWLRGHIRDLIDHLALALDRDNTEAFRRICNTPSAQLTHRGLGRKFLEACRGRWSGMAKALRHPESWRWQAGVADLEAWMDAIAAQARTRRPAVVLRMVLDGGYRQHLARTGEVSPDAVAEDIPDERLDEIEALLKIAERFESCQALVVYARQRARTAERAGDHLAGNIVLSTIHKLKGQERPVVFGIGWCEDALEAGDEAVGYLPHSYSLRAEDRHAVEDERCLAYVTVTRARDLCRLSGIAEHTRTGFALIPSRFVAEMGLCPAHMVSKRQLFQRFAERPMPIMDRRF